MNVQFIINSENNCDHIHVEVSTPNGSRDFVYERSDLQADPDDLDITVRVFLKYYAKTNNLNTLAKLQTALEGKIFKL